MAPKPKGRPSAKEIPDALALRVVRDYSDGSGEWPLDALVSLGYLAKVAAAKLHKLDSRGWISRPAVVARGQVGVTRFWSLTPAGVAELDRIEAAPDDPVLEYLRHRAQA